MRKGPAAPPGNMDGRLHSGREYSGGHSLDHNAWRRVRVGQLPPRFCRRPGRDPADLRPRAARNPSERITELLKGRLWQAARWSDRLRGTASRGGMLIQKRFEKERPASFVIDRLRKRWQQLHEADTDTTPMLRLVESRLEDLVRRVEFGFFPDEAGSCLGKQC